MFLVCVYLTSAGAPGRAHVQERVPDGARVCTEALTPPGAPSRDWGRAFECKLALLNSVTDSTVIAMGGCRPSSFQCHFDPTPVRSFST